MHAPHVVEDNTAYMGFVDKSDNGQQLWTWTKKLFFLPNSHDYSKHISYTKVMWQQNDTQNFP
jgi:hypothetical protein